MRGGFDDVYDGDGRLHDEDEDLVDTDEQEEDEISDIDEDEDDEGVSDHEEDDVEARKALHNELKNLTNYRDFITQNLVSKAQRHNAKVIDDTCWPKDRMMLIVRLERYLTHVLELTLHKMLNAFADDEWNDMGETLSATEASNMFDFFWGAMSKSWAIVYEFPQCLKEPVEAVYKERGAKAYSASIWGDVVQFGIASCQAYEKKLEEEEKKVIREVILRAKAAKKQELQEKQAARNGNDNWWDEGVQDEDEDEDEREDDEDDY